MKFLKNLFRRKPLIFINFKTYRQGKEVTSLAKTIEKIDKTIIIGVQPTDIKELTQKTNLHVFSEHTDPYTPGRHTGFIIPEAIKHDGAVGTFLNHSEHKIGFDTLKRTIERCKKLHLQTAVFVKTIREAKKVEKLKPTYLIFEPPELIATKKSVSTAKPKIIKKFAAKIKGRFLVGAGIHASGDITKAMELGASGVTLSSAIVTAKNPAKKLRDLLRE